MFVTNACQRAVIEFLHYLGYGLSVDKNPLNRKLAVILHADVVGSTSLVQLGRIDEARDAVAKLRELAPDVSVSRLRERWPLRDRDTLNMVLDGLRVAGLPE